LQTKASEGAVLMAGGPRQFPPPPPPHPKHTSLGGVPLGKGRPTSLALNQPTLGGVPLFTAAPCFLLPSCPVPRGRGRSGERVRKRVSHPPVGAAPIFAWARLNWAPEGRFRQPGPLLPQSKCFGGISGPSATNFAQGSHPGFFFLDSPKMHTAPPLPCPPKNFSPPAREKQHVFAAPPGRPVPFVLAFRPHFGPD